MPPWEELPCFLRQGGCVGQAQGKLAQRGAAEQFGLRDASSPCSERGTSQERLLPEYLCARVKGRLNSGQTAQSFLLHLGTLLGALLIVPKA